MPKLSYICYSTIPVMFSKASNLLPAVKPLPHAAVWELKSKELHSEVEGRFLGRQTLPFADGASQWEKIKTLLPKGQEQQQMAKLKGCWPMKSPMMNPETHTIQVKVKYCAFEFLPTPPWLRHFHVCSDLGGISKLFTAGPLLFWRGREKSL